jgi:hypothetical protein
MTRRVFRIINTGKQVLKKKILVWINKKVLGELRREQTKV